MMMRPLPRVRPTYLPTYLPTVVYSKALTQLYLPTYLPTYLPAALETAACTIGERTVYINEAVDRMQRPGGGGERPFRPMGGQQNGDYRPPRREGGGSNVGTRDQPWQNRVGGWVGWYVCMYGCMYVCMYLYMCMYVRACRCTWATCLLKSPETIWSSSSAIMYVCR